jgi:sugar lactone lactonase YvrE
MATSTASARLFVAFAFAFFTGCGGSPLPAGLPASAPQHARSVPNLRFSHLPANVAYASDYVNDLVLIYNQAGKHEPVGQISEGLDYPEGIAVDSAGTLYVANGSNSTVTVYPRGKAKAVRTLSGAAAPESIAVGTDGTVYVGTICSACPEKVTVYAPGATKPSYAIQDAKIYQTSGLALDGANNLYVGYTDATGYIGRISEYPPGSRGPGTQLPLSFRWAHGIVFDAKGNLVVVDSKAQAVDIFKPTKKSPHWLPSGEFSVPGNPWYCGFNRAGNQLYISQNRNDNKVDVYSYPAGKLLGTLVGIPGGDLIGLTTYSARSQRAVPKLPRELLYASDSTNDVIDVYDEAGKHQTPLYQITQSGSLMLRPFGVGTDANGDLYVTTTYTLGVPIYAPGATSRYAVLNDGTGYPDDVVVDRQKNAYVANMDLLGGSGDVTVFLGSTEEPSYYIRDPSFKYLYGVALDNSEKSLYVSFYDANGRSRVSEFPVAGGSGTDLGLQRGSYFGIAVDGQGNLVAANFYASEIDVFPPGAHKPSRRFGHGGRPWYIAFNHAKNRLFVADYSQRDQIDEYTYPEGALINTIYGDAGGNFVGVATGPSK